MMTMTDTAALDLAQLRALAEEGRRMPLLGGRHMLLWGGTLSVAFILHWVIVTRILPLPLMSLAYVWFGMTGLAALVGRFSRLGGSGGAGGVDLGNRIEKAVWQTGGVMLGFISLGIFVAAFAHHHATGDTSRYLLFALMPPIAFGVYAIALRATAEAAALALLKHYSVVALAFVPATVLLVGSPWQSPIAALGIVLVAIVPGLRLVALETQAPRG